MDRDAYSIGSAVLHLTSSLEVGGAERLLLDLVKSCVETQQNPQVVVVMNGRTDQNLVAELNSIATPTYYLGRPEGSRNPKYILDLLKIIKRHRIFVVHSHTRGSKYWSILCRVLRPRLRLVHTIHETKIRIKRHEVVLHNLVIDVTIAISRAVAEAARSLGIRRVEQIENGIPTSLFCSVMAQPLGSKILILSVGRLSPVEKGQDILIRAVRRCVDRGLDIKCTFVGSPARGDLQSMQMLEDLTSELDLGNCVLFVQGRTDVATLLAEANVFVLPSRREGFGLALVEAMAAGLPVIASNTGGPAEILEDGIDGLLFKPESDEDLAEKIALLVQSPPLVEKLRKNARTKACGYDIVRMRDKYLAVYRRLDIAG